MKKFISIVMSLVLVLGSLSFSAFAADKPTVYLVGDSTVCEYGTDSKYTIPRNGWGMRIGEYLDLNKVQVNNLAISGRSSKSFLTEDEYKTLTNNIKAGDYLFIGFGHNDAKTDTARYTDPSGSITDSKSTKYHLYTYYIKPALDAGATPILTTPIVRRKFKNNVVTDSHGLYDDCIRELAGELKIDFVDNTKLTEALYNELGYDEAGKLHAFYNSSNGNKVDDTHLNEDGARKVAGLVAESIYKSDCTLRNYLDPGKFNVGADDTTTETTTEITTSDVAYGDIDENGEITATDAAQVLAYALNADEMKLSATQISKADVDNSGSITATDAAQILTKALNADFVFK